MKIIIRAAKLFQRKLFAGTDELLLLHLQCLFLSWLIFLVLFTIIFFIEMIVFIFSLYSDNFDAIDTRIQILSQECVEDLTSQGFKE